MPPTDDSPRTPRHRRALGRGPGAAGAGATGPAPPAGSGPAAVRDAPAVPEAPPVGEAAGRDVEPGGTAVPPPAVPEAPPVPEVPAEPASAGPASASEPEAPIEPEPAPEPEAPVEPDAPAPEAPPVPEVPTEPEAPDAPAPASAAPPHAPGAPAQAGAGAAAHEAAGGTGAEGRFTVRLANFEGPFDLLLQLIAKHRLDVTEVALSQVTDEFMAHIRAMGPDWDLDQTTEFLVVAATLLDLKAARLLPAAEVEDEADLALLEARDLLFARLLQYRAYKEIARILEDRLEGEARRYPRTVGLEPHHAALLPEVVIGIGAEGFARLAVKAMLPRPAPQVYVDHIHAPLVSVREQAAVLVALLRERGTATFRELTEGVGDTLTVVARFLALLELYREKALTLDQPEALRELTVTWSPEAGEGVAVTDEFDRAVEEKP
ncbi:segregation and condensation protein A [Streptomyces sp. NPDC090026]|uniref:segregation and condensation protein A n=1 Tax=Streptomyces sp. NPDC090026 TaxID=3365923 RepID=UPI0037F74E72